MGDNVRALLAALAAFALFSSHDVVIKALGGGFSTFQIMFFSTLFSFPLILVMLMRDTTVGTLRPVRPGWSALRTVCVVITGTSVFYAFAALPLAQVYAILFAQPLIITVLSIPILGEKVGGHRWAAVVVGLVGVLVVLGPQIGELTLGHVAAVTAAIVGALAAVIVRKIGKEERSAVLLLYPMIANFVLMGGLLPFVYVPPEIESLGLLGVMSVLGLSGGFLLIVAYRNGDAAVVAPMQYSQMVWATIFGMAFFGETPSAQTFLGAGIIIASGVYIVAREGRSGVSRNRPVSATRNRVETGNSPRIAALVRLRGLGLQKRF